MGWILESNQENGKVDHKLTGPGGIEIDVNRIPLLGNGLELKRREHCYRFMGDSKLNYIFS